MALHFTSSLPHVARAVVGALVATLAACSAAHESVTPPAPGRTIPLPTGVEAEVLEPAGLAHWLQGTQQLADGRPAEAVAELKLALIYAPTSAAVHRAMALAWLALERPDRARQSAMAGLTHAPDEPRLSELVAELERREGAHRQAALHLRAAAFAEVTFVSAGPALVDSLLWLGERIEARTATQRLLSERPASSALALSLGRVLEDHGELELALEGYARARAQVPTLEEAALGEARVQGLRHEWRAAATPLIEQLAHDPDDVLLLLSISRALHAARDASAELYLHEAERLTVGDVAGRGQLAASALLEGDLDRAIRTLEAALERFPESVDTRVHLAELELHAQRPAKCLAVLGEAKGQVASDWWRTRAYCLAAALGLDAGLHALRQAMTGGKAPPSELLQDYARLLARDADRTKAWAKLETLEAALGDGVSARDLGLARATLADAHDELERAAIELRALATDPSDFGVLLAQVDAWARAGKLGSAVGGLESALRREPDHPVLLNALGFTLVEAGERLDEAEVFLRRAHRLAENEGFIMDSLGWWMHAKGRDDEAARLLERATYASPNDPEILGHLARVEAALGRHHEARQTLARALAAHPTPRQRRELDRLAREVKS